MGLPLMSDSAVNAVAKRHRVVPGAVLLSWHVCAGRVTSAKSVGIMENLKVVELTSEDVKELDGAAREGQRYIYPPHGGQFWVSR